ncbi:MAG: nicotinamide mononucleotide transporter [Candidatus Helarchaeota archaeon]
MYNFEIIQLLGWIGTLLFVYGVWILGEKKVIGFYANSIANLLYAWQSIYLNNHPLFWLSIFLIIINLRGIYLWTKKPKLNKIEQMLKNKAEKDYAKTMMDFYK